MQTSFLLLFVILTGQLFAQSEKIAEIRERFNYINGNTGYEILTLQGEEYLPHLPEDGSELKGFFKNNVLYKAVEEIGISTGTFTIEYYFWKGKLFFVYEVEKGFEKVYDKAGNFSHFDYSRSQTLYEGRHYFDNGQKIKTLEKGKRLATEPVDYVSAALKIRDLLTNNQKNREAYQTIRGKWTSTSDPREVWEFQGMFGTTYYDKEYIDEAHIKIDGKFLYMETPEEARKDKYEILSLTTNELKLLHLPSGKILHFHRK